MTTKSTPTLLGLPGELRNEIYRLALIEDNFVYLNDHSLQPGLLMTNRQIRKEAMPIFQENKLGLVIYDLKPEPHSDHWCWVEEAAEMLRLDREDDPEDADYLAR